MSALRHPHPLQQNQNCITIPLCFQNDDFYQMLIHESLLLLHHHTPGGSASPYCYAIEYVGY